MGNGLPPAPDGIAQYVVDALQRQDIETLESIEQYARTLREHLIARKNEPVDLEDVEGADDDVVDIDEDSSGGTVITKLQQCGADCRGCPHGPYRYRVTRDGKGGQNWEYLGKVEGDE